MESPRGEHDEGINLGSGLIDAPPELGPATRELSHSECWTLLGETGIAHLALRSQPHGVDIVPIDYLITRRQLFFKCRHGTILEDLIQDPHVAVQIERLQDGAWLSVVLKGEAARMSDDAEIERSGVRSLVPTEPGSKPILVRIIPNAITGRTFPADRSA
jgi:nitroimidazol reductase NimA-like FMN-containing flavoprotein (pyridoxamine 5'-phosphate oxidase superfamily)